MVMWAWAAGGAAVGISAFLLTRGIDVFPFLLLLGLGVALFRLPVLKGHLGGRTQVRTRGPAEAPDVAFDHVGGQEAAKRELLEALDFINDRTRVAHLGIRPIKGILMSGPPGTGKTLLARAAAAYTGSVFLATAGSEFIEMYAGVGAQRVRELFGRARREARASHRTSAIVFIDEIEVLAPRRGQHHGHLEYDQTVNQLLVEMDGLKIDDPVQILVMAASNRSELLDEAILRPGRFDRLVRVDLPDRPGRLDILDIHTRNKPMEPDVDLDEIARDTFGFSGAHLESVANEAAILAYRRDGEAIAQSDLREAVEKVMMGERSGRVPDPRERRRVAVHEVGHALMAERIAPGSVSSITVAPRGAALGYVRRSPDGDRLIQTRDELEADIAVAMAGTVSEAICLGNRSTGAAGDFEQAFRAARRIVEGGMSDLGPVAPELIPEAELHEATRRVVSGIEERVRAVLEPRRDAILDLAERLLEEERMEGEKVREAFGLAAAGGGGTEPHGPARAS